MNLILIETVYRPTVTDVNRKLFNVKKRVLKLESEKRVWTPTCFSIHTMEISYT